MMTSIYRGAGVNINVNILESSEISRKLNGEDICKIQIESTAVLDLAIGDYITVFSRNYYLNLLPEVTKSGNRLYKYDCIFESRQYELGKVIYMDPVQGGEFAYTGDLDFFVTQLVANMNRAQSGWTKGSVATGTATKNLQFSNENCLAVLQRLCNEYELTFQISESKAVTIAATSAGTTLTFGYGKGKGLYNLNRKLIDSANIITRVYPFGSERNIAANYRGGSSRLKLSTGYIEQNTGLYGIIEGVKVWDEVYPRFNGSVTSSSSPTVFVDSSIDFDLNQYIVPGTAPKVHFNSGLLSGYEFEILSYVHATKTVTLKETQQEKVTDTSGVLTPLVLPNSTLKPGVLDKYVFIDIIMPETSTLHYVTAAETELYNKAVAFLAENSIPRVAYELDIDPMYMADNSYTLAMGEYVTIVDPELGINRAVRIIGLTRNIWEPNKYTVEIGDQLESDLYAKMIGDVDEIKRLITLNKLDDVSRARNTWKNTSELRGMIFGTDNYFDPGNIKPESIETNMLSVGSRENSIALYGSVFEPNRLGLDTHFNISAGNLTHFTISTSPITWTMPAFSTTTLAPGTAYYIYARCHRGSTSTATYIVSATAYKIDADTNYYYFLLGILHSAVNSVRDISLTYGNTRINGRTVTTGRIASANGATYFDLDNNTIVMGGTSIADVKDSVDNIQVGGRNLVEDSLVNLSSNAYGFGLKTVGLISGQQYTFSVNGRCNSVSPGKFLRVFLYNSDWTYEQHIDITETENVTKNVTFIAPSTGDFYIQSYYEDASTPRDGTVTVNNYKVEIGNKATDWTPAPEDIDAEIAAAQDAADTAQSTAEGAQDSADAAAIAAGNAAQDAADAADLADAAMQQITNISSDAILSKGEKPAAIREYNILLNERAAILTEANRWGIITERDVYDNAVTSLSMYLGNAIISWNDVSVDSVIVAATWESTWRNVYEKKQLLLNKIYSIASTHDNTQDAFDSGINSGFIAGFTVDTEKLSFSNSSKNILINNAVKTSGQFGRGMTIHDAAANYQLGQVAIVAMGQLHTLDTNVIPATTPEYGFEIIKAVGPGNYAHLMRVGQANAMIAGWNIDYDAIYVGAKQTTGTYSTNGLTLASNGSIRGKNFYIDTNGYATFGGASMPQLLEKANDSAVTAMHQHNAEASISTIAWVKVKTITFTNGLLGNYQVNFQGKMFQMGYTGYAELRKKSTGAVLGAQQSIIYNTYWDYPQIITQDFLPGDGIELWIRTDTLGQTVTVRNLNMKYKNAPTVEVASTLT